MQVIQILICSSLSGVVSNTNLVLSDSNTSCATNLLCKYQPGDGYSCKTAGGNQDVQTTNCEALAIHYRRWAVEHISFDIILESLGVAIDEKKHSFEVVGNANSEILEELVTLRGRIAAAAVLDPVTHSADIPDRHWGAGTGQVCQEAPADPDGGKFGNDGEPFHAQKV